MAYNKPQLLILASASNAIEGGKADAGSKELSKEEAESCGTREVRKYLNGTGR